MKDNSGFSTWETERMFMYAQKHFHRLPTTIEDLVRELRGYEDRIHKEGNKSFILYLPDPVNYWEVYARLVMYAIHNFNTRFLFPSVSRKELIQ